MTNFSVARCNLMDITGLGKDWLCSIQCISAETFGVETELSVALVLIVVLFPKLLKISLII